MTFWHGVQCIDTLQTTSSMCEKKIKLNQELPPLKHQEKQVG